MLNILPKILLVLLPETKFAVLSLLIYTTLAHVKGPPRGNRDDDILHILERENGHWMEKNVLVCE